MLLHVLSRRDELLLLGLHRDRDCAPSLGEAGQVGMHLGGMHHQHIRRAGCAGNKLRGNHWLDD